MEKKNNTVITVVITLLVVAVLGLISFIVYDKVINKGNNKTNSNTQENNNNSNSNSNEEQKNNDNKTNSNTQENNNNSNSNSNEEQKNNEKIDTIKSVLYAYGDLNDENVKNYSTAEECMDSVFGNVCVQFTIYDSGKVENAICIDSTGGRSEDSIVCFKNNNYNEEKEKLKKVFKGYYYDGEEVCPTNDNITSCVGQTASCSVSTNGNIYCSNGNKVSFCNINSDSDVFCVAGYGNGKGPCVANQIGNVTCLDYDSYKNKCNNDLMRCFPNKDGNVDLLECTSNLDGTIYCK